MNRDSLMYRISWVAFALGLVSIALVPAALRVIDDGRPGWDQLPDQLGILAGGYLITVLSLAVSFVAGLYAWRQRKIALLWVVPSGIVVLLTAFYLLAWLGAYLVKPYWGADWV